jgi:hypothetical protein
LIVALQGADAIYSIIMGLVPNGGPSPTSDVAAVGTVFYFLAVFGLLRLMASFWLTDDFRYFNPEDLPADQATVTAEDPKSNASSWKTYEFFDIPESRMKEDYMSPNAWQSRLFRGFVLLLIIGLITLCILYLGVETLNYVYTFSQYILILFYLFFLVASIIIYMVYFVRGYTTTTVLPCISSVWYQIYTGVLLALALVLVIITSIETRKTTCGFYATWPSSLDYCAGEVPVASEYNATKGVFGLAVMGETYTPDFNTSGEPVNQMSVVFFNGWCSNTTPATGTQDFQFVGNFTPF